MGRAILAAVILGLVLVLGCGSIPALQEDTPTPVPTSTAIPALTTSFKVGAGRVYEFPLDVQAGTIIEYSYAADSDFNFSIVDPRNNVLISRPRTLSDQGQVKADSLGRYTLVFDNGFSIITSKNVTLQYRVVPPGGR